MVLCEGQTDPKYLKIAAELLGFENLHQKVNFDWIGILANGTAKDGGAARLRQASKMLLNNPRFLSAHTVLLFDCDQNVSNFDEGLLHVHVLALNKANVRCDRGIENLLPNTVFEDRFFKTQTKRNGADTSEITTLQKVDLCNFLCDDKKDPVDFEGFRAELQILQDTLFPEKDSAIKGKSETT